MNSQSIRVFLALTEYKNISDAAQTLYFSQSAVSQSLNQLEKELGVQLFFRGRGSRQIQLTPAGEAFLPLAQRRQEADAQIRQFALMQQQKSARIMANNTVHQYLVPEIIQNLLQGDSELELQLMARINENIPSHIENNRCDIAFLSGDTPPSKLFTAIPFFQSEICILCPADTNLPDRPISPTELNPRFEVTHNGFSSKKKHLDWHRQYFPDDILPQVQIDTFVSMDNYLTDPRSWAAIPMIQAMHSVSKYPTRLSIRRMDPVPYYQPCTILISKSYLHTGIINDLLRCCREFLSTRPYLIDCLPQ